MRAASLGAVLLVCLGACSSPTEPEPVPAGYAGEWSGTTNHGSAVSLSVSGDQVTSFTLTFNFSPTCSGTEVSPAPIPIVVLEPPGPPPFDQPGFATGWPKAPNEWGVAVNGVFSANRRSVSGEFVLVRYRPAAR
jgi:hypothetical protein